MLTPILSVNDVPTSVAFYTEKLGFSLDISLDGPDGKPAMAFVRLGDVAFGLSRDDKENVGQGVDFMVSVPDDADIDEVYNSVKAKGVAIENDIKTEYWGDRLFAVKDPDGFRISLCKTVEEMDMDKIAKIMRGEVERA